MHELNKEGEREKRDKEFLLNEGLCVCVCVCVCMCVCVKERVRVRGEIHEYIEVLHSLMPL